MSVGSGVVGTVDCVLGLERSSRAFSVATRGKDQVLRNFCLFERPFIWLSFQLNCENCYLWVFIAEIFAPDIFTH